jgi:acyl-CoA hydrolase
MTSFVANADAAVALIVPGSRIVIPPGPSTPTHLLEAICRRDWGPAGVDLYCSTGSLPAALRHNPTVRVANWQLGGAAREEFLAGRIEYVPLRYSDFPAAFGPGGPLQADVLLMQVSSPRPNGRVGPGLIGSIALDIIRTVGLTIAEVNDQLPFVRSEPRLNLDDVDVALAVSEPLSSGPAPRPSPLEETIARHVLSLIPDGATLQFGTGNVLHAVMEGLCERRHLGIHSGMITDGVVDMIERGAVTNTRKGRDDGITVTGMIAGTRRLYDFVHDNPGVVLVDAAHTHGIEHLIGLDRFVSINSAIEVDFSGQVNAEYLGGAQYSGIGGQADYAYAAAALRRHGGVSIFALPSTAGGGATSRIRARLSPGAIVSTPRYCVDFVVTEWGVADLRFRTLGQRAAALIEVAHPRFRDELRQEWEDALRGGPVEVRG